MGIELVVSVAPEAAQLSELDVIAFPVASLKKDLVVPTGLPQDVAGVALPRSIEPSFASRHRFKGAAGECLVVSQAQGLPTLLAVGIGDPYANDDDAWRQAAAALARSAKGTRAAFLLTLPSTIDERHLGESVTLGGLLASYHYDLRTGPSPTRLSELFLVPVAVHGVGAQARGDFEDGVAAGQALAKATATVRDMVNRIPSEMTPRKLANSMLRRLEAARKVSVGVWRDSRIEEERLGGLLGVARGSTESPRLVVASYDPRGTASIPFATAAEEEAESGAEPSGTDLPHIVLVGKGVTFDSGGLSLKTATGMATMKTDMTGAAIVLAAVSACHDLDVRVKVTAIAPMTENMPGGGAMKPGDVLTARNGTTIEVLNTDAEGRLILADGLSLAAELEPDVIIDVATLTGAAVVALGGSMAAVMANDRELAASLLEASSRAGEPLWELPLFDAYETQLESEIADVKNIGSPGQAGSITAGLFLQRFVGDIPWAHLDIAGPARSEKSEGYLSKGGTGFSLRIILEYLRSLRPDSSRREGSSESSP